MSIITKTAALAFLLSATAIGAASAEPDDAYTRSGVYDVVPTAPAARAATVYEGRQATPVTGLSQADRERLQQFEQRQAQDQNKN
ncbi:hypothetical protein [Prosthecomicrobium hirschii]|uniref:Uncharacterized protein n=1 Tax=Prosthecodimorpha hirschii TaxID=665126 RepID=A0A0P6VM59_9HYPH|nr:hypothetical protein [Prosthecomicrobium hirschii]KPL52363.1 hypothetical protein ABB55_09075 [Prosthecomicrobium hirschii]MCW1843232.1 hypothetical protein [Prosthecomicrobium hirschii]TPQ51224.1 hypothetical protein C2U72_09450 [Prosthecomicrobium hirschii]